MSGNKNLKICLAMALLIPLIPCLAGAKIIYVDNDATGLNDGTSWQNANKYLQDALADANSSAKPVEIRVAQGTYRPDESSAELNGTDDRTVTFQLINGVTLKGGYAGFGQPDPNTRDIVLYETILSGDLARNDVEGLKPSELLNHPSRGENSYHVFYHPEGLNLDDTAILDGFTITAGNANGGIWPAGWGGVNNYSNPPTLQGCTFSGNLAGAGGGMVNFVDSSPNVTNCTFSGNSAWSIGGMGNYRSNPTVNNCTFRENSAYYAGGGMFNDYSSPIVTNCTFSANLAGDGGGMYNYNGSSPTVNNCTFRENSAYYAGGAAFVNSSNLTFTDCVFIENSADDGGGMVFWEGSAVLNDCNFVNNWSQDGGALHSCYCSIALTNCSFNSNSATFGCGGGWNNSYGHSTVTNCIFNNNLADYGGGMFNAGAPLLLNCVFRGNSAGYIGGGMCNFDTDGIPVTVNCLFEGNSAEYGGGMYNNETEPTLINCRFSRNLAYESGGGISNPSNFTSPTLINCILSGNMAYQNGGAIDCFLSSPILINCTINGNRANKQGGGILLDYYCRMRIINTILWGDTSGKDGPEIVDINDSTLIVTHSDVQGGWSGEGNIDTDPCFAEPGYWDPNGTPDDPNDDFWIDGDYHLKSQAGRWNANEGRWTKDEVTSLCIDAGDPASPIGLEPFPNGGIINMGAYGGTAEASKSYFGKPPCETIVAGDINGDCKVDYQDLFFLSLNWLADNRQE